MRDILLSNNDLHRCKTPAAVWELAKFILMVSSYIKRKELERVNNNMTVFKICLIEQCTKIFISGNSLDNLLIFRFFVCVLQCVIDQLGSVEKVFIESLTVALIIE